MKYNVGDKFILEIEDIEKGSGYPYGVTGNHVVSEMFLDNLPKLEENADTGDYNKGLEDAWDLANKVFFDSDMGGFESSEIKEIFGTVYAAECFKGNIHKAIKNYKELQEKVEWSEVEVDTPVLVKTKSGRWLKRYFSKYEDGMIYVFDNGATSWSGFCEITYEEAKLAEE